jgi:hypothetical protein
MISLLKMALCPVGRYGVLPPCDDCRLGHEIIPCVRRGAASRFAMVWLDERLTAME